MLQNRFVFHNGNGRTLLGITAGFHHAFPSGVLIVFLKQVCLIAENGVPVGFCVMKIVDMIYLNASKICSSLPACLAGPMADQLTALQSPGLPSLHPSILRARTPPAAGF